MAIDDIINYFKEFRLIKESEINDLNEIFMWQKQELTSGSSVPKPPPYLNCLIYVASQLFPEWQIATLIAVLSE